MATEFDSTQGPDQTERDMGIDFPSFMLNKGAGEVHYGYGRGSENGERFEHDLDPSFFELGGSIETRLDLEKPKAETSFSGKELRLSTIRAERIVIIPQWEMTEGQISRYEEGVNPNTLAYGYLLATSYNEYQQAGRYLDRIDPASTAMINGTPGFDVKVEAAVVAGELYDDDSRSAVELGNSMLDSAQTSFAMELLERNFDGMLAVAVDRNRTTDLAKIYATELTDRANHVMPSQENAQRMADELDKAMQRETWGLNNLIARNMRCVYPEK